MKSLWYRYIVYRPHKLMLDCINIGMRLGTFQYNGFDYEDETLKFHYRQSHYINDLTVRDKNDPYYSFYTYPGVNTDGQYRMYLIEHIIQLRKNLS